MNKRKDQRSEKKIAIKPKIGDKSVPFLQIFAKLVNKMQCNTKKMYPPIPPNFHNLYIPFLPKFGKKLMDSPPVFSNWWHLCKQL